MRGADGATHSLVPGKRGWPLNLELPAALQSGVGPLSVRLPFSESSSLGMMLPPPGKAADRRRIAMPVVELSRAARDVLRRRAAGEGVDVTPESLGLTAS